MIRLKYLLLTILLLLASYTMNGQKNVAVGTVSGKIIDKENQKPVEFATIALLKSTDSTVVSGTVSDQKGNFAIEKIPEGEYIIRYSFIGFETGKTLKFLVNSEKNKVDFGKLELPPISHKIDEVVVNGEKSMYQNAIDRRIYNADKDLTSQSGSAADLLQNIPSVSVDIEGNISLRGSESVMMLVNGKPSVLNGPTRAEILQQMPANTIERIEVITNPSAKFKPDGTAGIINIVLKKNVKSGLNGSLIGNIGNQDRYSTNILLNYKPGKINFHGSYGFRHDERNRYNTDHSTLFDINHKDSVYMDLPGNEFAKPVSHIVRGGIDYDINKSDQFSISGNYNYRSFIRTGATDNNETYLFPASNTRYIRNRWDNEFEKEGAVNAAYSHKFAKEGHELQITNEYQQSNEQEDNHYTNQYLVPAGPNKFDNTLIQQKQNQDFLAIEYANPLTEDITLEAGYNADIQKIDQNFYGEAFNDLASTWEKDLEKSKHFVYLQNVHAMYGTYAQEIGNFGYMAGIRFEQSFITSKLITLDSIVPNNYFNVYPTLHLKQMIGKKGELQLNYSKRVNRPDGDDLNPFPEYQDPRNLRAGNPKLLPEFISSYEIGYLLKFDKTTFLATAYYRHKKNGFTQEITWINDSTRLSRRQNLATDESAGLEFINTVTIPNLINANLSANVFYNQIDASNLGLSSKKSNISWIGKINITTSITHTTMLQINASYQAPKLTPQGKTLDRKVVNIGLRQDIFKKKASLICTVSDIFNSMSEASILDLPTEYRHVLRKRDSRVVYLGFVYRFGASMKKGKDDTIQFDDKL